LFLLNEVIEVIQEQKILPAISNHQNFKKFLELPLTYGILMNFQLAQLEELVALMKSKGKKVLIHAELIRGLSSDEYGAIYLIQKLKVDGIISSKPKVIEICKKRGVIGIFRFFLKDSMSLEQSIELTRKVSPDFLEVLPATAVDIIGYLKNELHQPIMLGGLIQTEHQIRNCIAKGAVAVTTSNPEFWQIKC
jgi:glycerol uptake operon antiterminator